MKRRSFIKALGLGIAGFPHIVPASAAGSAGNTPPSERINMGFIGVGSMGGGHLRTFTGYDDVQGLAVCDLRRAFRERGKARIEQQSGNGVCEVYNDFRELLARDDIDAVMIAVPEHWHSLIGIEAARNGKGMYCEKPLTMSITDSKAVRDAVKRYGVVFQFGSQQRSDKRFRFACELARNGRLGKLHTIMVGSYPSITFDNQPIQPEPAREDFDYDTWLGPAPRKPYTFQRCASRAEGSVGVWTHIYDYSLGGLGGAWGIHHVDIAQWANDSDDTDPLEIEGTGRLPKDGITDTWIQFDVTHKYANGVTMIHMDTATALKRAEQFKLHRGLGILMVGSNGWVLVGRDFIDAGPKSLLNTKFGPDDERLYSSSNHRRNFLECMKSRQQTASHIDSAFHSDIVCHLDDIAMRVGRKLHWDPVNENFVDDDLANRMMSRPMRSPWRL
jgi:predicted dehydrogenase